MDSRIYSPAMLAAIGTTISNNKKPKIFEHNNLNIVTNPPPQKKNPSMNDYEMLFQRTWPKSHTADV